MKKRILTGDRPTGKLHIGHYFGSLKDRVAYQEKYDTFIIIADVQALTDNFNDPKKVNKNVYEVAIDNLAVGIDPKISTIFIQSMIPEIAELTIFYSNLVTIARLERNPTVKEELNQKREVFKGKMTFGFLGYPVSQAADITAFSANLVPVGEDQLPQIEQTQEIVQKFNRIYGKVLTKPEAKVGEVARVKGLDGSAKMSKSLNNAIYLADDEETITKKVMKAKTDPEKIKLNDPGHPEVCTVFEYAKMFGLKELAKIEKDCRAGKIGCVHCKQLLIKKITEFLKPIRKKRLYYENNPDLVEKILKEGNKKAREVAKETMKKVKKAMHLDYF